MTQLICAVTDIETTGLKQEDGHRIIEIAAALLRLSFDEDNRFLKAERLATTWCQRINPLRSIDAAAQLVHGISLSELRDEPRWEQVAPKVAKIFGAVDVGIAHNAPFDMPFIALELVRAGFPCPSFDVFCTMESGRGFTALGAVPSLEALCWSLGVDYRPDEAHAASYDVNCTVDALIKGLTLGYFNMNDYLAKKQAKAA